MEDKYKIMCWISSNVNEWFGGSLLQVDNPNNPAFTFIVPFDDELPQLGETFIKLADELVEERLLD